MDRKYWAPAPQVNRGDITGNEEQALKARRVRARLFKLRARGNSYLTVIEGGRHETN